MEPSSALANPGSAAAPDGFAPLHVHSVVRETRDAVSIVFDLPEAHEPQFVYQAGQFLTLAVWVDGAEYRRCYSMSSTPALGEDLRITVKRDRDGVVSNWLNDTVSPGDILHAAPPEGRFVLRDTGREVIAFAGGSGITPVFSLLRSALATGRQRVRLFYANRDRGSVIFDDALSSLYVEHADRLILRHHLDDDSGAATPEHISAFVGAVPDADFYICGPGPFMDTVQHALREVGLPDDRVHLERFEVSEAAVIPVDAGQVVTENVTIELNGQTITARYSKGDTLLQTARMAGLRAPSSCETGSCGTCMARLTEGSARMINNDALEQDEVDDGWVLTCQALPTSRTARVVYE